MVALAKVGNGAGVDTAADGKSYGDFPKFIRPTTVRPEAEVKALASLNPEVGWILKSESGTIRIITGNNDTGISYKVLRIGNEGHCTVEDLDKNVNIGTRTGHRVFKLENSLCENLAKNLEIRGALQVAIKLLSNINSLAPNNARLGESKFYNLYLSGLDSITTHRLNDLRLRRTTQEDQGPVACITFNYGKLLDKPNKHGVIEARPPQFTRISFDADYRTLQDHVDKRAAIIAGVGIFNILANTKNALP